MPIVVTGRGRPHEVLFLVFSALAGAAFVAGAKPPSSLDRLVPGWVLWTWYALLLISGVLGLVSFVTRDAYRALVMERAAMVGQTAAPVIYGTALLSTLLPAAAFAAAFMVAWGAASAWRAWQIQRDIWAVLQAGGGR